MLVHREKENHLTDKLKADRQCLEAQTKLSILSSYFKDKEVLLQRLSTVTVLLVSFHCNVHVMFIVMFLIMEMYFGLM